MNQTEWADYIAKRQQDVARLRERLANGEDEVTTAREMGFATRRDIDASVARVARSRG